MRGMGLGEDDKQDANPDSMVGAIMRQLLSKDVLHQSMKARNNSRHRLLTSCAPSCLLRA